MILYETYLLSERIGNPVRKFRRKRKPHLRSGLRTDGKRSEWRMGVMGMPGIAALRRRECEFKVTGLAVGRNSVIRVKSVPVRNVRNVRSSSRKTVNAVPSVDPGGHYFFSGFLRDRKSVV